MSLLTIPCVYRVAALKVIMLMLLLVSFSSQASSQNYLNVNFAEEKWCWGAVLTDSRLQYKKEDGVIKYQGQVSPGPWIIDTNHVESFS